MPYRRIRGFRTTVVVAGVGLALTLTACSSSGGSAASKTSSSGVGATTSAAQTCVAKAKAFLQPYDSLPSKLPAYYTPLSKKVPSGKTIIQLVGPIPSDRDSFNQLTQAAKTVGWTAKAVNFAGTVEDLNAKFEQAISDKPAAITVAGYPVAAITHPIADAKAAGIIVALTSVADQPTDTTGFAAVSNGVNSAKVIGQINAYQFMMDSNCQGSVAIFNLPFPILTVTTDAFTQTVKAECPACSVSSSLIQSADLGTPAATNAMVSKLQTSPKTKYIYAIIANLASGLSTALSQAGFSDVKIFGDVPDTGAIAALRNKTNAWWVEESSLMNGWTTLDSVLRVLDTGKPTVDTGQYPLNVLTAENITSGGGDLPTYPLDYEQEFPKLWNGGS